MAGPEGKARLVALTKAVGRSAPPHSCTLLVMDSAARIISASGCLSATTTTLHAGLPCSVSDNRFAAPWAAGMWSASAIKQSVAACSLLLALGVTELSQAPVKSHQKKNFNANSIARGSVCTLVMRPNEHPAWWTRSVVPSEVGGRQKLVFGYPDSDGSTR